MAGFVCSECRPGCISEDCNSTNLSSESHSVEWEGEEVVWCYSCGQIAPVGHINQDTPADGLPDNYDEDDYLGVTYSEDIK
jgi:Fe-S-cluster-containing hydrogenase component 2